MSRRTPFYLGVGAQRAGTTWLGAYFQAHPDIFISHPKELHYFDRACFEGGITRRNLQKRCEKKLYQLFEKPDPQHYEDLRSLLWQLEMGTHPAAYKRYFLQAMTQHKAVGEITPSYCLLDKASYETMREIFPDVRFLLIVRDPVERAWSQYKLAIRQQPNVTPLQVDETAVLDWLLAEERLARGRYEQILETILSVVPRKSIHVLYYESLFGPQQQKVVDGVCQFLSVAQFAIPARLKRVINGTSPELVPESCAEALRQQFAETYAYFQDPPAWIGNAPGAWRFNR